MQTRYGRSAEIDQAIDTDTGEFDMVMATDGEATDGHIINIDGLRFPEKLPLQLDHGKTAISNLGSVTNIRRGTHGGSKVYRGTGRIRLTGDGEPLAARRDLVDAIAVGDIVGTSLWWESEKHQERRALPAGHRAHVERSEKNPRKRFGLYFESAEAIEHSIVGIHADKKAVIGRSEAASDDLTRWMWHSIARNLDEAPMSREVEIIDALELEVTELEERLREAEPDQGPSDTTPAPTLPTIEMLMEAFATQIGAWNLKQNEELTEALEGIRRRLTG